MVINTLCLNWTKGTWTNMENQICYLYPHGVESGEELWRVAFPFRTSSAASPVVYEDIVYCSAGYGVGAGAFRLTRENGRFSSEPLWRQQNKLMNHWSTPVCSDGYLYGMFSFKKYGKGPLACVDIRTGETMWSTDGYGPGNSILVGDVLVSLSDAGAVTLVKKDPSSYQELARVKALRGKCWSSPSFSDGQLYVRSTREGVRLDLVIHALSASSNALLHIAGLDLEVEVEWHLSLEANDRVAQIA